MICATDESFCEEIFLSYVLSSISFVLCVQDVQRGVSYLRLRPDRVAMQDATAQVHLTENMYCIMYILSSIIYIEIFTTVTIYVFVVFLCCLYIFV